MIRHIWSVICMQAVIDKDTNLISLINVVEQLNIPEKPSPEKVVGFNLEMVSYWVRESPNVSEKAKGRVLFVSPSGLILKSIDYEIDLSTYERLRSRSRIVNFPAPESGQYMFKVEFSSEKAKKWKQVASVPLQINFTGSEKTEEE